MISNMLMRFVRDQWLSHKAIALCALLSAGMVAGCGGHVQESALDGDVSEGIEEDFDFPQLTGSVVFVSDRSGIQKVWTLHAGSKSARRVTRDGNPDSWPRFSPDGRQILYTTCRAAHFEIWRMNRDGSSPIFVANGAQASWAPDGRSIAFFRDNQLYFRELAAATERQTAPRGWIPSAPPAWSPDGKSLALSTRQPDRNDGAFILNLCDDKITPLILDESWSVLQWSSDGKKLLCQDGEGHICQIDPDGMNREQLTAGADFQQHARYSPDGFSIIFCRASDAGGPWQICMKDITGEDLDFVQLTRHGSNLQPDWHASD